MAETAASVPVKLHPEWLDFLQGEFEQPYMRELRSFLVAESRAGKTIYPKGGEIFNALNLTPLSQVKVVILGQDPYHGPGQAHGLCFSVREGVPPPPSLQNIFQELKTDVAISPPKNGNLENWAKQGVLLLNTVLTVEQGKAASHRDRGWERFTDKVIQLVAAKKEPTVFFLWGSFAQSKSPMIPSPPHLVLKSVHPSPLSAYRGFFGCKHFSLANEFLKSKGRDPVDWSLSP